MTKLECTRCLKVLNEQDSNHMDKQKFSQLRKEQDTLEREINALEAELQDNYEICKPQVYPILSLFTIHHQNPIASINGLVYLTRLSSG